MKKGYYATILLILAVAGCGQAGIPTTTLNTSITQSSLPTISDVPTEPSTIPAPTSTPIVIIYKGVRLQPPKPDRILEGREQLPPAWLIIGTKAVLGTNWGYTIQTTTGAGSGMVGGGDPAPPQMINELATATVRTDTPPTIVIGSESVKQVQVRVADWTKEYVPLFDPSVTRALQTASNPVGNATVLTLAPNGASKDSILLVSVTFEKGNVNYIWHLNPVK